MLSVIIADNSFATRERAMLSRLEVGLADEGVRVVHAVPSTLPPTSGGSIGLQSTVVRYEETGLPFSGRRRAADLALAIEATSDEPPIIDIIHAFGAGSWPIAVDLARLTGAGLLLELWCPALLASAAALLTTATRSKQSLVPSFIVSEPTLAAALRKRSPQAMAYSAPWGVHSPDHPHNLNSSAPPTPAPTPPPPPRAIAMLCDTGDPRFFTPALAGLVEAIGPTSKSSDVLIFACIDNAPRSREAALWSAARKLNILDRFTIVPEMESHREPILQMDLLLLPEANGRQRTLTLEAMAAGIPVIATADPFMETLDDGHTARLVRSTTPSTPAAPAAWAGALSSVMANPTARSDLIRAAHEYVRSNRSASTHIAEVLRAYQQVARPALAAER